MRPQNKRPSSGGEDGLFESQKPDGIDNHFHTPPSQSFQVGNAPATAPELLDYLYLNVELELRLGAVKAIQAATDFEIGESDLVAERNMLVAADCLKEALANFDRIKEAKITAGAKILAEAFQ